MLLLGLTTILWTAQSLVLNNIELEGSVKVMPKKARRWQKSKAEKEEKIDIEQYPTNTETKRRVSDRDII